MGVVSYLLEAHHLEDFIHVYILLGAMSNHRAGPAADWKATILVIESFQMVNEEIFSLLHHFSEEVTWWNGEVTFHVLDVLHVERKHFRLLNTLNTKVASIENSKTIFLKTEVAFFSIFIMYNGCDVHHVVLGTEILQNREFFNI